jgi:chromosome segregation ATPase
VTEAKSDLKEAQQESSAEYQKFKNESEEKIRAHEKSIAEFKARIAKEKTLIKNEYEMKIAVLEQKNSDLKKRLDEFKEEGKDKWAKFKVEFSHDLDELGKALKDFTTKNVK